MHTYSWYALLYSKLTHIVKQLYSNKDFKKQRGNKTMEQKSYWGKKKFIFIYKYNNCCTDNKEEAVCFLYGSVQFSCSVVSDSLRLHELQHARPPCPSPTPGVYQSHAHRVGDAIQPSHPLSSPSPPAPNPSQHQGLFQWVNSLHEVTKLLEFQLQLKSFQWTPRTDLP